jgi:acyl-CoA reductase-like NAD-dependent aldehyde dehydrogenase
MADAAAAGGELVRNPGAFFIGGEWTSPSTPSMIEVFDSATEEPFLAVAEAQAADIERAVAAARQAFDHGPWPRMTPQARAPYLKRIAEGWMARREALGDSWTAEAGILRSMAGYAAHSVAAIFNYYAELAETYAWAA